jgi:hypothetical protein
MNRKSQCTPTSIAFILKTAKKIKNKYSPFLQFRFGLCTFEVRFTRGKMKKKLRVIMWTYKNATSQCLIKQIWKFLFSLPKQFNLNKFNFISYFPEYAFSCAVKCGRR